MKLAQIEGGRVVNVAEAEPGAGNGNSGGNTTFGALLTAYGGGGGNLSGGGGGGGGTNSGTSGAGARGEVRIRIYG